MLDLQTFMITADSCVQIGDLNTGLLTMQELTDSDISPFSRCVFSMITKAMGWKWTGVTGHMVDQGFKCEVLISAV